MHESRGHQLSENNNFSWKFLCHSISYSNLSWFIGTLGSTWILWKLWWYMVDVTLLVTCSIKKKHCFAYFIVFLSSNFMKLGNYILNLLYMHWVGICYILIIIAKGQSVCNLNGPENFFGKKNPTTFDFCGRGNQRFID